MFDNELCFESLFIHTEHFHGPFQSLFPEMSLVLGNFLELFGFVYQSYVIFFFFPPIFHLWVFLLCVGGVFPYFTTQSVQ